ncbi:multidrug effflux MFS transporter [Desulfobacter vibrioformis]|uniref:multidrug effflux MFS transporter n=1 Tax=Desulfobacter vibrioformis TaxID=34031 RepID=UPI000558B73D|nr:multidrug effflux MFS transporter [Desulfobacter vibrioformis]
MHQKQKFFGDRSIIAMLALLSAFPPLSTDLYLPALPHVMEEFNAGQTLVNLSLSLFLISFSLGILIWGPVSEKYGRKPILLTGLVLYTLSSIVCAMSTNVTTLVLARVFQGFGGGAGSAVATAMVKDMYTGRKRESVLAVVMAMVIVAPVVAPVAGAQILRFMSWHAIYWALAGIGLVSFCLSLFLDEPLETPYPGSLFNALGRLAVVMKNPGFSILLMIFSMISLPIMTFIGASAFIYIQGFGMDEQAYSYYFGLNALGALAGPLIYIQISRWFSPGNIIIGSFTCMAVSGSFIFMKGSGSPFLFAPGMLASTLACTLIRPPSTNLLLSQQDEDTGSAASLINFMAMFIGSLGMFLISLETVEDLIPSLGLIQTITGVVCGGLWLLLRKRAFIRKAG